VISRRPSQESLRDFVFAELYTDRPPHGPENRRLQIERFRTVALPLYVILSPDGSTERRRLLGTIELDPFLAFLSAR
jgi:hypothetical protein